MVALEAYFDDSKNPGEGIFAVAGYLSTVELWDDVFTPSWCAALKQTRCKVSEFKAADCRHRCNEFESWTRAECNELTERLVSLIVGPAMSNLVGVGAAVAIQDFADMSEEARQKWERFAYLLCLGVVTNGVFQLCERYLGQDTIRVVFDEQHDIEYKGQVIFSEVRDLMTDECRAKIPPLVYERSVDRPPLQAADLLAYETYKEMKNRTENPPRKISTALKRLVEGKLHHASYFGRKELAEMHQNIRAAREPESGFYRPPTIYSSAMKQRIRALLEP